MFRRQGYVRVQGSKWLERPLPFEGAASEQQRFVRGCCREFAGHTAPVLRRGREVVWISSQSVGGQQPRAGRAQAPPTGGPDPPSPKRHLTRPVQPFEAASQRAWAGSNATPTLRPSGPNVSTWLGSVLYSLRENASNVCPSGKAQRQPNECEGALRAAVGGRRTEASKARCKPDR